MDTASKVENSRIVRLIICGSRHYKNFDAVDGGVFSYLVDNYAPGYRQKESLDIEIVSGCEPTGVDRLGEQFAEKYGFRLKKFPADWNRYGRSAGPRRNAEMAAYATDCVAFWDGQSRGTYDMICKSGALGLDLRVYMV